MFLIENGPKFTSEDLTTPAEMYAVKLVFIKPGSPTQHAFIENLSLLSQCYPDGILTESDAGMASVCLSVEQYQSRFESLSRAVVIVAMMFYLLISVRTQDVAV